jgi:hypothetical protein
MGHALRQVIPRTRYEINLPIALELIGSQNLFRLRTENVSAGGIFVRYAEDDLPFNADSILEARLSLGEDPDTPCVHFVAKFVHLQEGVGFGMRIVQIEDYNLNLLSDFLIDFGHKNPEKQY